MVERFRYWNPQGGVAAVGQHPRQTDVMTHTVPWTRALGSRRSMA